MPVNLLYVIFVAVIGYRGDSMALISCAAINLGDVFSMALTLTGIKLAHAAANHQYTSGYQKTSILISLLNSAILFVASGALIIINLYKLHHPAPVNGSTICLIAGIGVVINILSGLILRKDLKRDLNIRGSYVYIIVTTIASLAVIVAGALISATGIMLLDALVALIVVASIVIMTWYLLRDSLDLTIDSVPKGININKIKTDIAVLPHVKSVHRVHVWALSNAMNAMTAHVTIDDRAYEDETLNAIKRLAHKTGIKHPTIQFETHTEETVEENPKK